MGRRTAINDAFDHVYCINLDRRPERWKQASSHFKDRGVSASRFSAVDGSALKRLPSTMSLIKHEGAIPGAVGCHLSHRAVFADALAKGYERILVLEDDVEFVEDLNERFKEYWRQVPADWHMLYLSGNHQGGFQEMTPNVARIFRTFSTSSYAASRSFLEAALPLMTRDPEMVPCPVDVFFSTLHPRTLSLVFRPHLAWQRDGFSDVLGEDTSYRSLRM